MTKALYDYGSPLVAEAIRPLINSLKNGYDAHIIVLGDSTSDETIEWPYVIGQRVGQYLSSACVLYRLWNDSTQMYDAQSVINAGSSGQMHYVFDGTGSRSVDTTVISDNTGDLDIDVDVSLDDWTPASTVNICGKWGPSGAYSWRLRIGTDSKPILMWSNDGTTQLTATATASPTVVDGKRLQIRVTLDVDNGSSGKTVNFYTRAVDDNGNSTGGWVALGSAVTTAGTTSVFSGSRLYEIGGVGGFGFIGKMYSFSYKSGIGGYEKAPALIDIAYGNATYGARGGSPTLYIWNGSKSGADYAYMTDATRMPKMLPNRYGALVIVSDGHNEGAILHGAWFTILDAFKTGVSNRLPYAQLLLMNQNPTTKSVTSTWDWRMTVGIPSWCTKNKVPFIDSYKSFVNVTKSGTALSSLIIDDGIYIHPNDTGRALIADAMSTPFVNIIQNTV